MTLGRSLEQMVQRFRIGEANNNHNVSEGTGE
jgi:hypothetical protein